MIRLNEYTHQLREQKHNKKLYLTVEDVDVAAKVLGHDPPAQLGRLLRHVGHLQEHGAREVAALEEVEVDVHVVRSLPSALGLLLLRVLVLHDILL